MTSNKFVSGLLALISVSVHAGTMGDVNASSIPQIYMGAYGGYGVINGAIANDGNFAQGRLSLGINATTFKNWDLGIEAAVQSGNSLRLSASDEIIDAAGGLPMQSTLKPFVDLLVTVKGELPYFNAFSYMLKGGIAYRQLNLENRSSPNDTLGDVDGEFQAGIGYKINEHITINALYQGIYAEDNASITLNSLDEVSINHIPTQQAGLLGIDYTF